jgi:hypothetical protein
MIYRPMSQSSNICNTALLPYAWLFILSENSPTVSPTSIRKQMFALTSAGTRRLFFLHFSPAQ